MRSLPLRSDQERLWDSDVMIALGRSWNGDEDVASLVQAGGVRTRPLSATACWDA